MVQMTKYGTKFLTIIGEQSDELDHNGLVG